MPADARIDAARAFVRSLNLLLRFARMYDFGHPRTEEQRTAAWQHLRAALDSERSGLLLAVSGDQLLLDGAPIEADASEKHFAHMLASAGIASIHFAQNVTPESLTRFVKAFPTGANTKPGQIAEQLKAALQDDPFIHVNEVCFVPADSAVAKTAITPELAARALGSKTGDSEPLLNDPGRMLQLIAKAGSASAPESEISSAYSGEGVELVERWVGQDLIPASSPARSEGAPAASPKSDAAPSNNSQAPNQQAQSSNGSANVSSSSPSNSSAATPNSPSAPPAQSPVGGIFAQMIYGTDEAQSPSVLGRWQTASAGIREPRPSRSTPSLTVETGFTTLHQDEVRSILRVLAQAAESREEAQDPLDSPAFQSRIAALPRRARYTLSQAMAALAAQAPSEGADKPTLLRLAEHVAIQAALQNFQTDGTSPSSIRRELAQSNREVEALRKLAAGYEAELARAGIEPRTPTGTLMRDFWDQVAEGKKRAVLEGPEAWCVPGTKAREFVERMRKGGEAENAEKILQNYASCLASEDSESRAEAARGIAEMASAYAASSERLLLDTIRAVGVQMAGEANPEAQSAMRSALVNLSQEAVRVRSYPAIRRAVEMLDYLDSERPGEGASLRPQLSIDDRVPQFIEEAVRARALPSGLAELLRRIPQGAAHVAERFGKAGRREDCELLLSIVDRMGPEALEQIRAQFQNGSVSEALDAVPVLARLDCSAIEAGLAAKAKDWPCSAQDRLVRQIAASGAAERGRLLVDIFDVLDPLIRPLAVDEIGLSAGAEAGPLLLRLAEDQPGNTASDYLRIKAVEALGRLRTPGAGELLRKILQARRKWRWVNPSELRITALQAMQKIDPEWARDFTAGAGFSAAELALPPLEPDPNSTAIRQRRYDRMLLAKPVAASISAASEQSSIQIPELSLGGGVLSGASSFHPGSIAVVQINAPQRVIRMQTIVRYSHLEGRAFEILDISYEDRAKLRKLLLQSGATKLSRPDDRTHSTTRTLAPAVQSPST